MSSTTENFDLWKPCSDGEVAQMARRLRSRRFVKMVGRDTAVLTVLMMTLFGGYFYFSVLPTTRIDLGGITCSHLKPMAANILTGRLDKETQRRVEQHLRQCPFCRRHMEMFRENAPRLPSDRENGDWFRRRFEGTLITRNDDPPVSDHLLAATGTISYQPAL